MTTTDDAFGILRFLIALGHFDGEFTEAEKQVVLDRTKFVKLSVDQKAVLLNDFENPQSPEALFDLLTARARAQGLDVARSLLAADGIDLSERALLKKLSESHREEVLSKQRRAELDFELATVKALAESRSEVQRLELRNQWIRVLTDMLSKWT